MKSPPRRGVRIIPSRPVCRPEGLVLMNEKEPRTPWMPGEFREKKMRDIDRLPLPGMSLEEYHAAWRQYESRLEKDGVDGWRVEDVASSSGLWRLPSPPKYAPVRCRILPHEVDGEEFFLDKAAARAAATKKNARR